MTPVQTNARSSVEINDSCNNCCPRWCCGRKVKHHRKEIPRTNASSDLTVVVRKADIAIAAIVQPPPVIAQPVAYADMPSLPQGSK